MPLRVYTGRLPHHGQPGYDGPDRLNVTRGSGTDLGLVFAPSAELLAEGQRRKRAAKRDEAKLVEAWEWYAPRYVEEMRSSYRAHRAAWQQLLARSVVTLACYCGTSGRCHRRVLAGIILPKLGAIDCGERS